MNDLGASMNNPDKVGGNFWGPFFLLNDARYIFDFKNLKNWFWDKKW